jgi:carbamate kinase
MSKRAVISIGGNAFLKPGEPLTMATQFRVAADTLEALLELFDSYQVVLTHGNGPQVGHMLIRVEEALGKAYAIPLEVCVAESEGELGYVLQQSLYNLLVGKKRHPRIAALLTQVLVDQEDSAFAHPTKPIGPFYDAVGAEALRERGFETVEDAGRGYRRVVASPEPKQILGIDMVEILLDAGATVITSGGGGIPVVDTPQGLKGVEAVVDKDAASALLGVALDAELLLLVTSVPCAYTDFGGPRQAAIGSIDIARARELLAAGHFAEGSMRPKVSAAVSFVAGRAATAVICNPENASEAAAGRAGTVLRDQEGIQ